MTPTSGQLTLSFSFSPEVEAQTQAVSARKGLIAPLTGAEIIDSEEKLDALVKELEQQSLICVDLETTGLNSLDTEIVGYAIAYDPTMVWGADKLVQNKDGQFGSESLRTVYIPVRHVELERWHAAGT